jgi:hypothetical protein
MKRSKDGSDNWKTSARRQRYQVINKLKADDEGLQLGTRILWIAQGIACAALGCALLTILTR